MFTDARDPSADSGQAQTRALTQNLIAELIAQVNSGMDDGREPVGQQAGASRSEAQGLRRGVVERILKKFPAMKESMAAAMKRSTTTLPLVGEISRIAAEKLAELKDGPERGGKRGAPNCGG